jgi:hypothetical protein
MWLVTCCDLLRSHPTMVTLGAVSFLNWGRAFGLLMGDGWMQQIHVSICFQPSGQEHLSCSSRAFVCREAQVEGFDWGF